jgi:hypothetical protein
MLCAFDPENPASWVRVPLVRLSPVPMGEVRIGRCAPCICFCSLDQEIRTLAHLCVWVPDRMQSRGRWEQQKDIQPPWFQLGMGAVTTWEPSHLTWGHQVIGKAFLLSGAMLAELPISSTLSNWAKQIIREDTYKIVIRIIHVQGHDENVAKSRQEQWCPWLQRPSSRVSVCLASMRPSSNPSTAKKKKKTIFHIWLYPAL